MKLRKLLAGTLAASMVIAAMPMASFAATKEKVNRVPQVSDDYKFDRDGNATYLTLQEDGSDEYTKEKQVFNLVLENAEFYTDSFDDDYNTGNITYDDSADYMRKNVDVSKYVYGDYADGANSIYRTDVGSPAADSSLDAIKNSDQIRFDEVVKFKVIDKTTVEVTWTTGVSGDEPAVRFPLPVKACDPGDMKVKIDSFGSELDSTSLVFAVAGGGTTTATISGTEDFSDSMSMNSMKITETANGAVDDGNNEIKLKLPPKFSWSRAKVGNSDAADAEIVTFNAGFADHYDNLSVKVGSEGDDSREVIIKYTLKDEARPTRGYFLIKNLRIDADSDAKYGDVDVKITGDDINSESLTVGKYQDYSVTVKADGDVPELLAGRWDDGTTVDEMQENEDADDVYELQKLVIKENISDSWLANRKTKIEFPDWVKIVAYDIDSSNTEKLGTLNITTDEDFHYIEVAAPNVDEDSKSKLTIRFYVSVEADATGDITATVSGKGLDDEHEAVLGKAIAPVTVTADVKDVRLGRQKEVLGDLTIAETKAEAIDDGDIVVKLPKDFKWSEKPEVKVTEGDIEIEDVDIDDEDLTINVKGNSRTASTIKISDVKVDMYRDIPEGEFKVEIGGDAIVQNHVDKDNKTLKFDKDYVVKTVYANVVTPNSDDLAKAKATAQKASFTVGSANYTVGQDTATADAAPYIQDGRTMVPVKYVAFALGIDPQNIKWDQATKTATIFGSKTVSITIGKNQIVVDGNVIAMDTKAVVKDGRAFLPIAYAANALGVPYTWDNATKTVTFN